MIKISPIRLIPNASSKTEEWRMFYDACKTNFGQDAANIALARAWSKVSDKNPAADVVELERMSGVKFDKSFMDSARLTGANAVDFVGGALNTMSTGGKLIIYGAIGIGFLLLGGVSYRIVTASAQEVGEAAGAAAKTII